MRTYVTKPDRVEEFTQFFLEHLFPPQRDHGARLVGRWLTEDERMVAVFEYDDRAHFEQVDAAVRADPRAAVAQARREELGPLFERYDEVFMRSTLPPGLGFVRGSGDGSGDGSSARPEPPGRLPA
jgi:hypothetical protein